MDQVELHPHLQQWELLEYCKKNGIAVTAYYPLGGSGNVNSTTTVPLMKDPVLLKIAENHHKTSAQVMIRWAIQRGTVCIPKSSKPARIDANKDVFDFELTEEEMKEIRSLDRRHRYCGGDVFLASPLTWKDIWDGENIDSLVCFHKQKIHSGSGSPKNSASRSRARWRIRHDQSPKREIPFLGATSSSPRSCPRFPAYYLLESTMGLHSGDGSFRRIHAPADQTQLRSTQLRVLAKIHTFSSAMASVPTLHLSEHFKINAE